MKEYQLFIDESGSPDPHKEAPSPYILCGCSLPEYERERLKILADQIKFKYWNRTDIVFHSRDIGRDKGDFAIFRNNAKLKNRFLTDLYRFLRTGRVTLLAIIIDKELARRRGWNKTKVIKETAHSLIYHFIALLLSKIKARGKIVIESATSEKDRYYLDAFSYFISPGFTELGVDFRKMQKVLTSISFVTKNNFDIEEQIADLFAYAAACKFQKRKKKIKKDSYEENMVSIFERKLFAKPTQAKKRKMRLYEKIEPFCILPKK